MPSLGSHLARAHRAAERLAMPEVDADRGAYYLGATAPDVRVITRLDRSVTHFYDLDDLGVQDSIARMFDEHPALAHPAGLDAATIAFVCGFMTHLVLDEQYIEVVFRTKFGAHSDLKDEPRGQVLDRALQYEIDRRDRLDRDVMSDVEAALASTAPVTGVPFIEDDALTRWVTTSIDVAGQAPDFERFERMMARHMVAAGYDKQAVLDECADPETLVGEAFEVVSADVVERFWADATDLMTERVRDYLR
jgi:hypothetical protein